MSTVKYQHPTHASCRVTLLVSVLPGYLECLFLMDCDLSLSYHEISNHSKTVFSNIIKFNQVNYCFIHTGLWPKHIISNAYNMRGLWKMLNLLL